ncbi:Bardet-Biedl syndrome 7 protein homolog [Frankliniella occidentalis]|uniref:Bardet-Biedl syndrome 7 protein homolog n=1 Tax=Frankliniella occidentalis TaxID=133901 RepID=A0A6J1SMV8_FRAOC|nr:Bardet-Biedl syndrome 7 protein homolog [Frankliniella occidentalis]
MDLELIRVDYSVSGITLPSTMELLPASGARLSQKVIIGDQEGVLQSFSMKKGEQQMVFKTLPGTPISRVCLGGAIGTIKDKIFISKRGEVHGYTKKGKLFLGFDTCLAESIKSMHVNASTLLLSGNTVYNQFRDCEDTGSFLSTDTINDVIALPGEKTRSLVPVLACADGVLRVLDGAELESQSRQARSQPASARSPSTALRHEVRVPCAPTVLHLAGQDGGDTGQNVLFGTDDGRVGMVTVTRNTTPSWRWLVDAERPGAAVSSLHCHDLAGDGDLDLIVGRDDGSVEVYATTALDPSADASSDHDVHRRFTYSCPESVSSVRGGVLGTQGYDEVVVSSYTGMVFGLTTERVDGVASMDSQSVSLSQDARRRLQLLRAELGALEEKVSTERDRYLAAAEDGESALSVVPYLNINHKLSLIREEAAYLLTLEAATAIDNVLVQSDVPVDVLDVDRNSAVVSFSDCEPESDNKALVTFRCQMNTTRLDVRLRTVEGRAGHLRVYVTPLVAPKCAALRVLFLPPLSLHARAHRDEAGADARPYSVLTLRGHFSLAEMHAWLAACLPDLSEKPPAEPTTLCFQNACMSTMLICSYGKGEAEFRSDNVSTISIIKDVLSKMATGRSIHLDISCVVNPDSGPHALRLMFPVLREQAALHRDLMLLDALRDLDKEALAPKFLAILDSEDDIRERVKRHPTYLDRLCGMLTDLYIDHFKFRGVNVKGRVPQLLDSVYKEPLDTLLEALLQHFQEPLPDSRV